MPDEIPSSDIARDSLNLKHIVRLYKVSTFSRMQPKYFLKAPKFLMRCPTYE